MQIRNILCTFTKIIKQIKMLMLWFKHPTKVMFHATIHSPYPPGYTVIVVLKLHYISACSNCGIILKNVFNLYKINPLDEINRTFDQSPLFYYILREKYRNFILSFYLLSKSKQSTITKSII